MGLRKLVKKCLTLLVNTSEVLIYNYEKFLWKINI